MACGVALQNPRGIGRVRVIVELVEATIGPYQPHTPYLRGAVCKAVIIILPSSLPNDDADNKLLQAGLISIKTVLILLAN